MENRIVHLTQGRVALVDAKNYERLNKHRWYAKKNTYGGYWAARQVRLPGGKQGTLLMHRFILELDFGDKRQGDHRNHNTLDNCEDNLRICTATQNQHNRKVQKGTSKYKGVHWIDSRNKWRASIKIKGVVTHLGIFKNGIDAALAYDRGAIKYFGEFASPNF